MEIMKLVCDDFEGQPLGIVDCPNYAFQNETAFFNHFGPQYDGNEELILIAGRPFLTPSVISQQYFCQVPQLKSTGTLLVAVVVADLVFLQTSWMALKWLVTVYLLQRHPEAIYCAGCAKGSDSVRQGDGIGESEEASVSSTAAEAAGEGGSND